MVSLPEQSSHRNRSDEQTVLGRNLRIARIRQGVSAKNLAKKVGVSPSMISKIESGATNPSMDVLRKIVMELNVPMTDLMQPEPVAGPAVSETRRGVTLVRSDERKTLRLPKRGLEYQMLTPDAQGAAEFVWFEMEPQEGGAEHLAHKRGEESVLVLQGVLTVDIAGTGYELNPGDCLTFDATLPHLYRNEGPGKVICLYVAIPPTL